MSEMQPTPRPFAPDIDLATALFMRIECSKWSGREIEFACGWDPVAKRITSARIVARGGSRSVVSLISDYQPGEMSVHNHPYGSTEPSDADMNCAARFAPRGIGAAVITSDASELYVLREPVPSSTETATRSRVWSLGPLTLILYRRAARKAG